MRMRLFVLAFVAGTLALQHAAELPDARVALIALAALLAVRLAPERRIARGILLLVAGAAAGVGLAAWRADARLADALPPALEGRDVELTGLVASLPQVTEGSTRFVLDVERVSTDRTTVPSSIALAWYAERVK